MKKILFILSIVCHLQVNAQTTRVYYMDIKHGDTAFQLKITQTLTLDSVMRYAIDSSQYKYYFYNVTGTAKDSIQQNKLSTSQLNNTAGFITPTALVPYTPLLDSNVRTITAWRLAQRVADTAAALQARVDATAVSLAAQTASTYETKTNVALKQSIAGMSAYQTTAGMAGYSTTSHNHTGVYQPVGNYALQSTTVNGQALSGNVVLGYTTGNGGTVTQITSRSTGITLNKLSGAITTNNASLAAGAEAIFVVTNSTVAVGDVILVSARSGQTTGTSIPFVTGVANGSFSITLSNHHATTADTGAMIINFVVIKAVSN